jgi:tetratricopeptide (TPR) repeat protein/predicted Ser/Thr protein kinase
MNCLDDTTLAAFLTGSLEREASEQAEEHMASCTACRSLVAELARLSASATTTSGVFGEPAASKDPVQSTPDFALGRYRVYERIGAGAMGVVFAAIDPELGRKVALKVLHPALRSGSSDAGARLRREAQIMARLSHANVRAVFDVGHWGGHSFVAMELIDGDNLRQWLRSSPRHWTAILEVLTDAARGLSAAHEVGIVHRDFKPDNVLVGRDKRVCVSDFGLAHVDDARLIPFSNEAHEPSADVAVHVPDTNPGALLGTPVYMAPEQFDRQSAGALSDQFSFCVTAYEAFYGHLPFTGSTVAEIAAAARAGRVAEAAHSAGVPAWLHKVVVRGLSADPMRRHASMNALLEALDRGGRSRGRWARPLMVVAALAITATATIGLTPRHRGNDRTPFCGAGASRLAGVWDDPRRSSIRAGLLATRKPYAADTWGTVERAFDQYRGEWVAGYESACLATSRGEQSSSARDLEMACLDRRLDEWKALGDVLVAAEGHTVERAASAAFALTPVARCQDVASMTARVPPPVDTTARGELRELESVIGRAKALYYAGQYPQALPLAKDASERARTLAYRPTQAEALFELARLLEASGDPSASEATFREAINAAEAGRADDVAARARVLLVWEVALALGRPEETDRLASEARAAIERLGDPFVVDDLSAALLTNVASIQNKRLAKYDDAARNLTEALAIREKWAVPNDPRITITLNNLGTLWLAMDRLDDALAVQERCLGIRERALGADHPDVAVTLANRASVLLALGKRAEAGSDFRRALSIFEGAGLGDGLQASSILADLAETMDVDGHYAETLALHLRALAMREKILGPDHPDVAAEIHNVGSAECDLGRYEEAKADVERAEAISMRKLGPEHPSVAVAENTRGEIDIKMHAFERAAAHFERAIAIWEKALGPDNPRLAKPLTGLGIIALSQGRLADARAPLERALTIAVAAKADPVPRGKIRFALARALWAFEDQRSRAAQLALQAEAELTSGEGASADDRHEMDRWLDAPAPGCSSAPQGRRRDCGDRG